MGELPKDRFFKRMEALELALTYDDVRLRTGHSEVMPDDCETTSLFSRNVPLLIPVASAAMDTVTEYRMAIEMAKLGGIGVIHKNLSPEKQAEHVARVKFHLNGRIDKPICVREGDTIEAILNKREDKGWTFHSLPVLDSDGKLVGILTQNDFDFCTDYSLEARHVMTQNPITGDVQTDLDTAYSTMAREKKKVLPLVNPDGTIAGMYLYRDLKRIKTGSSPFFNIDTNGQLRVAAAIGVYDDAYERVELLVDKNVDVVVIDTAHGDSRGVIETLKEIKRRYGSLDVVAGNISEPESAKRLLEAGADGIKVGQGPGSICTTRVIAGIGCPQVTAVYECAKVAREYGVPIIADGGLRHPGDIPIAIGAGAHSVMMGSMLAVTDEAPGEIVYLQGRRWKAYRGMGSMGAMEGSKGSRERYGQKDTGKGKLIPEGIEGLVEYKGPLGEIMFQYVGGLKRGMGYVGAKTIEELREKADFRRFTSAGSTESHPHDVVITKEAPNYSTK